MTFTGGSTFNAVPFTTSMPRRLARRQRPVLITVERADGATDFDGASPGALVYINQANDNGTSDGEALMVRNLGGGTSVGLYVLQNGVDAPTAKRVSQQAMVVDVNEAAGDVPGR